MNVCGFSHQVDGNLWQQLRKGTQRPRHVRGGALAAGLAGGQARTGRGLLGGGRRTSGSQGAPGPAQAQVEEAPPEPRGAAWVCPRRPRPSCPLAPEPRGGARVSPRPLCRAGKPSAGAPRGPARPGLHTPTRPPGGQRGPVVLPAARRTVTPSPRHPASPRVTAGSLSARAHSPWFWAPCSGRRHRGSLAPWPVGASFILFFGSF